MTCLGAFRRIRPRAHGIRRRRCCFLVQLKGGRGGVRLVIGPRPDPKTLVGEIIQSLESAAGFLGNARIAVEVADETISPELAAAISEALLRFPTLGLASIGPRLHAPPARQDEPKVVRRTVRSGQEVTHQGDLVVLGDVHVGGRLVATGDVIVVGALRGFAWAGAEGNEGAIIYAQPLEPTQVRIAGAIAQGARPGPAAAEYAHLEDGKIVVEPWVAKGGRRAPAKQSV